MNFVELYCGSGTVESVFYNRGFATFKIDNRRRKGICEPTLRKDIMKVKRKDIPFDHVHALWCSFPCQVFSHAAGAFHFIEGKPVSKQAEYFISLLVKTLKLIDEIDPDVFFIENPRGHLRYRKEMIDFLVKKHGMIKELTYSSYGFPTKKPTNIFTNARDYFPKDLDSYGRGAKNNFDLFDSMTVCQRQKIPVLLAQEICDYVMQSQLVEL